MLSHRNKQLSIGDSLPILHDITYDDVLEGSKPCPRKGNPGLNGLSYEILHLAIAHPRCCSIVTAEYNVLLT